MDLVEQVAHADEPASALLTAAYRLRYDRPDRRGRGAGPGGGLRRAGRGRSRVECHVGSPLPPGQLAAGPGARGCAGRRLARGGHPSRAVELGTQAVDGAPDDHVNLPWRRSALAEARLDRYRVERDVAALDAAVALSERAWRHAGSNGTQHPGGMRLPPSSSVPCSRTWKTAASSSRNCLRNSSGTSPGRAGAAATAARDTYATPLATVALPMPRCRPKKRLDQCVTANVSGGGSSVAAMMEASSTVFGRPGRGSSSNPARPCGEPVPPVDHRRTRHPDQPRRARGAVPRLRPPERSWLARHGWPGSPATVSTTPRSSDPRH